jgi:mannose-6-phosphate isomerase-like protein (cupin superfamily)
VGSVILARTREGSRLGIASTADYTAERARDSTLLADFDETTVRLHWADEPYRWHVNTGPVVFVVLDGEVEMRYRDAEGNERARLLRMGDIAAISPGDEHVAVPRGAARVLVVERADGE